MKITSVTIITATSQSGTTIIEKTAMGHNYETVYKKLNSLTNLNDIDQFLTEELFYEHQRNIAHNEGGLFGESKMVTIMVYHRTN